MKIGLKFLEKNAFFPTFKIDNSDTDRSFVECTKFLTLRDQVTIRDRCDTGISVSAAGTELSVPCHVATGPLVSCHGLRKYWHFVFYEVKSGLMQTSKKEKREKKQKALFQGRHTEGKKDIELFNKLKEKIVAG